MLKNITIKNFTVFKNFKLSFSQGINIFIGINGTGKTHLLKLLYSACEVSNTQEDFAKKINAVFLPSGNRLGRLVNRYNKSKICSITIIQEHNNKEYMIDLNFSNHSKTNKNTQVNKTLTSWSNQPIKSVYIPAKDILANSSGFISLYYEREIHFEEIYVDIIRKALLPKLKTKKQEQKKILNEIQKIINGKVIIKQEEFFLCNKQGNLEFTLLAEGFHKLGLLWILIQNGTLLDGSILFWDEPESNLNPLLIQAVVKILLQLQNIGVQIFIATHNYSLIKQFDLFSSDTDKIYYHSLYKNEEDNNIFVQTCDNYNKIIPNSIEENINNIAELQIKKDFSELQ